MGVQLDYQFEEVSTNVARNSSNVLLNIWITTSGESWNGNSQTGVISWGGEYSTDPYTLPRNTQTLVHSETKEIFHNADGTGITSFACDIPTTNAGGVQHGEGTIGLTTLPVAATIDEFSCSSNYYLNDTMKIKYTPRAPYETGFTYKLRLSIPNVQVIKTENLGRQTAGQKTTYYTFTSSEINTIYGLIGANANSCRIGAVIETYNGNTKIGESPELYVTLKTLKAAEINSFSSSGYTNNDNTYNMQVKYTPKISGYKYKLRLSIPHVIAIKTIDLGTINSTSQQTVNATFTYDESNTNSDLYKIYNKIGANSNYCIIGAVIETYNGDTKIGESSEITLTLTMPSSIKPSITNVSKTEATSGLDAQFGAFIQNKSKLNVSFTPSGKTAGGITSTIQSCIVTVNNQTFNSNTFTTDYLSTAGTNTLTIAITDTRGRSATYTEDFQVLGYTKPTIISFTADRDSSTNTTINVSFSASITPLDDKNTKTYKIYLDNEQDPRQTYSDSYSKTATYDITGTNVSNIYSVKLQVIDYFDTVERTIKVGSAFALMHITEDGNAMAIGHYYNTSADPTTGSNKDNGILQIGGKTVLGDTSAHYISTDGSFYSGKTNTVGIFKTNPAVKTDGSATQYYVTFSSSVGGTNSGASSTGSSIRANDGLRYLTIGGTTTVDGESYLYLGNGTSSGTSGNKRGCLRIFSNKSGSCCLVTATNQTAYCSAIYLPQHNGWLLGRSNLYNNETGTTGTITLSETAANFAHLVIYYGRDSSLDNTNRYNSVTIDYPNNKKVVLSLIYQFSSGGTNGYQIANKEISISGTSITNVATGAINIVPTSVSYVSTNENSLKIFRIDGYK